MNTHNSRAIISMLMQVREVTTMHLPIGHSFIPYEMMLIVILHYLNGEELTVKRLFNSGTFSEMGNRYHFRKLIEKDWITLKDHPTDSRLKLIVPAPKLLSSFELISDELLRSFLSISKEYLSLQLSNQQSSPSQ
jgi:hypothetical protein